jgi:hypothetical protein
MSGESGMNQQSNIDGQRKGIGNISQMITKTDQKVMNETMVMMIAEHDEKLADEVRRKLNVRQILTYIILRAHKMILLGICNRAVSLDNMVQIR